MLETIICTKNKLIRSFLVLSNVVGGFIKNIFGRDKSQKQILGSFESKKRHLPFDTNDIQMKFEYFILHKMSHKLYSDEI